MSKSKTSCFELFNGIVVRVIAVLFTVTVGIIGITPQLLKDVGKTMDNIYAYIPQWVFLATFVVSALGLTIWFSIDYFHSKEKEKMLLAAKMGITEAATTSQNNSNGGVGFQDTTITGNVNIFQPEVKKKIKKK